MTTRIVILPEVIDYFLELASVLYKKEYLGFEESAIRYAKELFEDIQHNLADRLKKVAPKYFDKYGKGMFYTFFKRNKNTSWYVFFNIYHFKGETVYFVRYVSNAKASASSTLNDAHEARSVTLKASYANYYVRKARGSYVLINGQRKYEIPQSTTYASIEATVTDNWGYQQTRYFRPEDKYEFIDSYYFKTHTINTHLTFLL